MASPPLIALGSSLSDHSDVEPDDSTSLSDLAPPASTCSIADNWTVADSRCSIVSVDTLLRQSCLPESIAIQTAPSHVITIPENVPIDTLSWQLNSPESQMVLSQSTVVPYTLSSVASLRRSSVSTSNVFVTTQLSSLVSPPVVSGHGSLLGEVGPQSSLQSVMSSRPELNCVDVDVPLRSTPSPARSSLMTAIVNDQGIASSRLHEKEIMVESSILPPTHTPFQSIPEGRELSPAALVATVNEQSCNNTLGESTITADADSSTETDTPNAVVVKTEADETITLSSSDGEDAVGIPPFPPFQT